eukprot:COSAG02_NODE_17131_length_1026_cov_1.259978_3_plen_32_part_01
MLFPVDVYTLYAVRRYRTAEMYVPSYEYRIGI